MRSAVRAIVLCEDRQHRSFLGRLLEELGVTPIRFEVAPSGLGSAEQWVRARFPEEARKFRGQSHQRNLALVVMIDGDRFGVRSRKDSLDAALVAQGVRARGDDERLAYLVPTWSIETWLAWLTGADGPFAAFGESAAYKDDATYRRISPSARDAVSAWKGIRARETAVVPSLTDARTELERLPVR